MTIRKTIDIPKNVLDKLQKDADKAKRNIKNHIEFVLIQTTEKK